MEAYQHRQVIVPGKLVDLGPIRWDLAAVYQRWMNDLEVSRTLTAHWRVPFTVEDEVEWFEQAWRDPIRRVFTIENAPMTARSATRNFSGSTSLSGAPRSGSSSVSGASEGGDRRPRR